MPVSTEPLYPGDWLKSEDQQGPGHRSREEVTILAGSGASRVLTNGMVVSKVTMDPVSVGDADGGNTGDGTMGTITETQGIKLGVYKISFVDPVTDLGDFIVEDPDGITLGMGRVGTAFTAGGLSFTIADGAANFVAGDQFTITVSAGSNKVVQFDEDGIDGTQTPIGVLYADVTALDAVDNDGVVIVRSAEVRELSLVWPSSTTAGEKTTAVAILKTLGIIPAVGE